MTGRQQLILTIFAIGLVLELLIFCFLLVLGQGNPFNQVLNVLAEILPVPTTTPTSTRAATFTPTARPTLTPALAPTKFPTPTNAPPTEIPTKPISSPVTKPGGAANRTPTSNARVTTTATRVPATVTRVNPTPTQTATIVVIEGTAIQFVTVTGGTPGNQANVSVQTAPNANCSIYHILPDGTPSKSPELSVSKRADASGLVAWTWRNENEVKRGAGIVVVTCNGVSATAQIKIE
jgi:hypothetical protein